MAKTKPTTLELLMGLKAAKVPANIIGDFGSGKSSMVYQMGEHCKCHVVMKSLNKMDTTDFSGVPYLSDDLCYEYDREGQIVMGPDGTPKLVRAVKNSPSPFIKELLQNPNSILFLDEINRAAPALQSAALTLIQDGDAGDVRIAKSVWRVSAMNAFDVGVNAFSQAAANRFCHIYHQADPEVFKDGFITGFKEEPYVIINNEEEVLRKRLQYRTAVANFISENPTLLSVVTEEMSDELAFPTPRTWEMVTEVMAHLDQNSNEYINILVNGCVGKAAGKLFVKYVQNNLPKLVDLTEYLGKEDTFVLPNPDRIDEVYSLFQNLQYWFNTDPSKYYKLWRRMIKLLHNNEYKYGKYTNYDNYIAKYWMKNIGLVLAKCMKNPDKDLAELRIELEGAFDVFRVDARK